MDLMYYKRDENTGYFDMTDDAKQARFGNGKRTMSGAMIADIIADSFESQSTYWLGVYNVGGAWRDKPESMAVSEYAVEMLLDGYPVELFDIEEPKTHFFLTLERLIDGYYNAIATGCNSGEDDADTVVQYALFGKEVYG